VPGDDEENAKRFERDLREPLKHASLSLEIKAGETAAGMRRSPG
jgi:hypothetical protein